MKTSLLFFSTLFSPWVLADEAESQSGTSESEPQEQSEESSSDDGEATRKRVEPVPLPPTTPPAVPTEKVQSPGLFGQSRFSGDLRFATVFQRLDALDSRVDYLDPSVVLTMPWASGVWTTQWQKGVDTRFGLRILSGADVGENVRLVPWDASLRVAPSSVFALRVGWLAPSFGNPEHHGIRDFYLAGIDQFHPLSWQTGMSSGRNLAANLELSWDGWMHWEVQVGEVRGGEGGRYLRNRVSTHLPGGLAVYLSEQTEFVDNDKILAFSESELGLGVVLRRGLFQAMGEYLLDLQKSGAHAWQSMFSYAFITPKRSWDQVELLGRLRWLDPHRLRENDGRVVMALGGNIGFSMPGERMWRVSTLWEMDVPQDKAAAIEHEAVVQLGIAF